jgi:hypothetical protein
LNYSLKNQKGAQVLLCAFFDWVFYTELLPSNSSAAPQEGQVIGMGVLPAMRPPEKEKDEYQTYYASFMKKR